MSYEIVFLELHSFEFPRTLFSACEEMTCSTSSKRTSSSSAETSPLPSNSDCGLPKIISFVVECGNMSACTSDKLCVTTDADLDLEVFHHDLNNDLSIYDSSSGPLSEELYAQCSSDNSNNNNKANFHCTDEVSDSKNCGSGNNTIVVSANDINLECTSSEHHLHYHPILEILQVPVVIQSPDQQPTSTVFCKTVLAQSQQLRIALRKLDNNGQDDHDESHSCETIIPSFIKKRKENGCRISNNRTSSRENRKSYEEIDCCYIDLSDYLYRQSIDASNASSSRRSEMINVHFQAHTDAFITFSMTVLSNNSNKESNLQVQQELRERHISAELYHLPMLQPLEPASFDSTIQQPQSQPQHEQELEQQPTSITTAKEELLLIRIKELEATRDQYKKWFHESDERVKVYVSDLRFEVSRISMEYLEIAVLLKRCEDENLVLKEGNCRLKGEANALHEMVKHAASTISTGSLKRAITEDENDQLARSLVACKIEVAEKDCLLDHEKMKNARLMKEIGRLSLSLCDRANIEAETGIRLQMFDIQVHHNEGSSPSPSDDFSGVSF